MKKLLALVCMVIFVDSMGYGVVVPVMAAAGAGALAGPALGGILNDWLGYKAPFLLIAVICLAGGIIALADRDLKNLRPRGSKQSYRKMARSVLANPGAYLTLLVVMMGTVSLGVLDPLFPVYLEEKLGLGSTGIGILFALIVLTYTVFSPFVGRLSDKYGKKRPIILGLLATAVAAPALAFSGNLALIAVLFGVCGVTVDFFETPTLPLIADMMSETGEGEVYGTAFGLFNMAWAIGYMLGPAAGGFLAQRHGLPTTMIILSLPLVILAWRVKERF